MKVRKAFRMKGLTAKQQDLLDFIGDFTENMHMAPTIYEIAAHLGIRPSTAFVHLNALCKKGAVSRSGKARSILITEPYRRHDREAEFKSRAVTIRGNAPYKHLHFDSRFYSLAQNCSELFALDIQADALPDAGILCGDMLLLQQKPVSAIHPGNLVLLEENGHSIICRCLTRSKDMLRMSANGGRILNLSPGEIVLLGCVIGLQRRYNHRG